MAQPPTLLPRDGRTLGWRLGMLLGAGFLGGIGYAVVRWPQLLVWAVAGVFFALAAVLALSAMLARGRAS